MAPRYALLVYGDDASVGTQAPEGARAGRRRLAAAAEALGCRVIVSEDLESGATATTVRGDAVLDGPLVAAADVLAAVHVVEAPDLDAALALARACPVGAGGGVEVRPAMDTAG